jgi:replicative DNA helicase
MIDYLELLTNQNLLEASRALKQLAKNNNVAVLAIAGQLRGEDAPLTQEEIGFLQYADIVATLCDAFGYISAIEDYQIKELILEKHRNGPLGSAILEFKKASGIFLRVNPYLS